MSDLSPAERQKIVELERRIPILALGACFAIAIAIFDLFSGAIFGDGRLDAVLVAGCLVGLWALVMMRHFVRARLGEEAQRPPGPAMRFSMVAFIVLSLGVTAGFGFVFGGPRLALVLVAIEILFVGLSALGKNRRNRPVH